MIRLASKIRLDGLRQRPSVFNQNKGRFPHQIGRVEHFWTLEVERGGPKCLILTHFQQIVTLEPDVRSCFFTPVLKSSRRARHSWTTFEALRTLYTGWRPRFQSARDLEFFLGKAARGDFWGSRPLRVEFKICSEMGQNWFETKFACSAYGEGALSQKMGSFEKRMKK